MKQLSDFLVLSDMDGTLLDSHGEVPERNKEAIRRFVAKGGRFGIATGRSRGLMLEKAGDLPINGPCVLYNGGALYDFATDSMPMTRYLPETSRGYLEEMMQALSDVGTMVICEDSYYQVNVERDFAHFFLTRGDEHFHRSAVSKVAFPWFKVLFLIPEQRYDAFWSYVNGKPYPDVRFVATNRIMAEMLPRDSSKASALERAVELGLVSREDLVAIGDYYNDLEMIAFAGMGVTLGTSPADIREKADLVVGDCDSGAVADLIEHLEQLTGE